MQNARQISLFIAITLWAIITGAVLYTHIAFFPPYLSHLPESNSLITGDYGIKDGSFWMLIHPITLLATIITLVLNWKLKSRRKSILIALGIYVLALIVTAIYFVPALMEFAKATPGSDSADQLYQQGQTWQHLSWIRGGIMYIGFLMLLVALTRNSNKEKV